MTQGNFEVNKEFHIFIVKLFCFYQDYDSGLSLRFVRMHFYSTTFDRITKDRAAKFVDRLSAIGGTMGLLTGFSIISGVEMVYFALQIILKFLKDRQRPRKNIA